MLEILLFLEKLVKLEGKDQHAVIRNENTTNGMKTHPIFGKSQGMMLYLFYAHSTHLYFSSSVLSLSSYFS